MSWQTVLNEILDGYFSDWSIKDGVAQLVFVAVDHPEYHQLYLSAIDEGIEAASHGDPQVVTIVGRACYVENAAQTLDLLKHIRQEYVTQYADATKALESKV